MTREPFPGEPHKQKAFKQHRVIKVIQLIAAVGLIIYGIVTDDRAKLYGGIVVLIIGLLVGWAVHRASRGLDKKPVQ